ncbi:PAS domain S-box protein [Microcoleus sp. bin38.metabat.b11b12b14.051]|uniref:PAS domain S-box protein n=1 Tax=Microcoleus sp. bin38.metabat.b11b12b14.051 TaxID=2742709 RepID=UPI0025EF1C2B|nr:PAS domain S-box protein [Microcoleus sp. bin38.metabat.b11b12b14.051]
MQTKPVKQKIRLGMYAGPIAHQQPAEAAVSESQEGFRRFVERSADAVAMVDCEMRYICVSRRWQTDWGVCPSEARGRTHGEFFPNIPEYWQQNARACLAGVLEYSEFVAASSPPSVTEKTEESVGAPVKWAFWPWKNSSGAIGGLILFAEKIADRTCHNTWTPNYQNRQLETKLQLTQTALDNAADTVFLSTSDGKICYANKAACDRGGYLESELLNLRMSDIDSQLSASDWQAHWDQLKQQSNLTFETTYQTKDGASFSVEVQVNYLAYGGCEYCCAIARDISARLAAQSALVDAKEQLQAVLDAVPGLVSWVSSDFRYLGVNRHLANAYQMPGQVFVGQKIGFIQNSQKFNDLVYEFFATSKKQMSQEITVSVRGENKNYLIVAQKYQRSTAAVFVGLDITESKQSLWALQQSEERLRLQAAKIENTLLVLQKTQTQLIQIEKMSSLGQLVAGIAHEINNPVSFISGNVSHATGYIQELLRSIDLYQKHYPHPVAEIQNFMEELDLEFIKKDLPKLLNSMKVGSQRIRDVVRSLRLFSRTDEAEMKTADIHEGLDSTVLILQNRLQAKGGRPGISLIKEYGNLPRVRCYAGELNQVFMHLLTNAIDALEEGGRNPEKYSTMQSESLLSAGGSGSEIFNPEIRIRTEVIGESEVAIAISDNGPGMTQEVLGCIFDPLFTTKCPTTSTGLGLAISQHLVVEKHGGELQCISRLGEGTELIVKLAIGND